MKTLKESLLDDEDEVVDNVSLKPLIEKWLRDNEIRLYKINKDNTIDLKQNITIKKIYLNIFNLIKYMEHMGLLEMLLR